MVGLTTEGLLARLAQYAAWDEAQLKTTLLAVLSSIEGFDASQAGALDAVCAGFSTYFNSRLEGLAQAIVLTLEEDAVVTMNGNNGQIT